MKALKTIYLESTEESAKQSSDQTWADMQLNQQFRGHVRELIVEMFETYKITIWAEPRDGRLRSFQRQQELLMRPNTTKAGPGESNHNWGFAVDLGFQDLKWLEKNASIVTDNHWLI